MTGLPTIANPIKPLFVRDGVEIALITVERWPGRVVVRLSAVPSEITEDREREHEIELSQWGAERVAKGKDAVGPPPHEPGWELLSPLEVSLTDDAGTVYIQHFLAAGGSGTHWDATWFFDNEAPDSVERLIVEVVSPENESASVAVELKT